MAQASLAAAAAAAAAVASPSSQSSSSSSLIAPPSISQSSQSFSSYSGKEFSINLHPPTKSISDALRELIIYLNWTEVAVIYEDDISLILLQELVKPPPLPKNVQFVFRKSNPESFRDTLRDIKSRNIYSMIIDVKPESVSAFVTAVSLDFLVAIVCHFPFAATLIYTLPAFLLHNRTMSFLIHLLHLHCTLAAPLLRIPRFSTSQEEEEENSVPQRVPARVKN